jgi:hypothetical protein
MKIGSIYQSTVYGIERGLQRMRETANDVARAGTSNKQADVGDIAKSMVELKVEKQDIKANLTVLKTEDEILGKLFDDLA